MFKKILILTDNEYLLVQFRKLIQVKNLDNSSQFFFNFAYSPNNKVFVEKYKNSDWIIPLRVKENVESLVKNFDLIFSLHCKQIFPSELVNKVKCINIHPGLNPNNRGWFPQVFSIINALPCGATIHEIDEYLDHGPVIFQKQVAIEMWDTSLTAYNKILDAEIDLLSENLENILYNKYKTFVVGEGNLNLKTDFDDLCQIDLESKDTFKNHINRLRALTHGDYANAYFVDESGCKIYVKIELKKK
jgi:methionyl-tRNA formyltransferase